MPVLLHRIGARFVHVLAGALTATLVAALLLAPAPARAVGIDGALLNTFGGTQKQGRNIVVRLRAGAAEIVSIAARGHVRQGGKNLPLRRATATVVGGSRATLELRPRKNWQERRIKRALNKGRTLKATVRVRFRDILGNVGKRTRTIRLR